MRLNFRTIVVIALLPLFAFAASCATANSSGNSGVRIIAIGDLHGDFEAFEELLLEAELIDRGGRWAGGDSILVQTGDVPDRGPDSRKIIERLRALQEQAPEGGGQVVTLVGNHEAMNVIGDLRYVHPGEYEAFRDRRSRRLRDAVYDANRDTIEAAYLEGEPELTGPEIKSRWMDEWPLGKVEHRRAWRPAGEIGEWVAQNPAAAIVNGTLFVHGGISSGYLQFSIAEINAMTAEALMAAGVSDASILTDPNGPMWYRGNIPPTDEAAAANMDDAQPQTPTRLDEVNAALAAFGVNRIVVGHTVSPTGVKAHFDGKVIQIDTGIASYYGGTRSFLEIKNGVLYAHDDGVVRILSP